ncbi:MAG TPA: hypothetical protein ENK25_06680 [Bacteroidetes bacterium]|nr:hypothetical protein [Bacteroidota bacterium]
METRVQKLVEEFSNSQPAGRPYNAGITWHKYDFKPAGISLTYPESWTRDTTTSVKIRTLGLQIFPWKEGAHPVFSANQSRLEVYTVKPGTADPSFAPQVINLDQKLGTTANQQEEPVMGGGMSKTLRYSLLAGALLFLLIIAGMVIILKQKH